MYCLTTLKHGHEFSNFSLSRLGLFNCADTVQNSVPISAAQRFRESSGCRNSRLARFEDRKALGRSWPVRMLYPIVHPQLQLRFARDQQTAFALAPSVRLPSCGS
jgi:hypothetical protein